MINNLFYTVNPSVLQQSAGKASVSYLSKWLTEEPYFDNDGNIIDTKDRYKLKPVGQSCLSLAYGSATSSSVASYLDASATLISGNKFAFEMPIYAMDTSLYYRSYLIGNKTEGNPYISLKSGNDNYFRARNDSATTVIGTQDSSSVNNGVVTVIANGTELILKHNGTEIDRLTIDSTFTLDRLFNSAAANYSGVLAKVPYVKIYNLNTYTETEINNLDLSLIDPTYYFVFNNVGSVTGQKFYDLMGTGVYVEITSDWTITNKSTCDGLSYLFVNGYAVKDNVIYPKLVDGTGYAGLVGEPDSIVPAINNETEQAVEIQDIDATLVALDEDNVWVDTDGENAKVVVLSDIEESSYTKMQVIDSQITLLGLVGEVLPEPALPDDTLDFSDQGYDTEEVNRRLVYLTTLELTEETINFSGNAEPTEDGEEAIVLLASQGNQIIGN